MKFFSTLALLAVIAQCTEAHQMLRSASTKTVDFSDLSESGSGAVGSKKHKPRDGSWDGKKPDGSWGGHPPRHPGGRRHGPRPPKGSFDGSFPGPWGKWAGSFDGSFPGPHGKWPGSFDGSFPGPHGKNAPFPGKGKGKGKGKKKASSSDASEDTEQQTTQQEDDSGSE
ncbi:hypothetical protein JG687_00019520 [Phytophthora cactorum]|uniref:Secreted protein n=1 Tax=Phytophthora cactorum TaxID=29920 RepID=A0A329S582_9STRA|nr:hypothetical protein Pcac1_g7376 [Phytophthora cactorum]KAG2793920.1 hypothetical protein PC111_g22824 [Phytophthora cactorum]KAG2794388.1 hypothetical protein PC112_g23063 [Phytophthora cactorum]KAG2817538.1 hypothetical protein PC113_g22960 [Phytophthora cactorum]KAG2873629.1 hypothetical protein PC114_g25755 [Phytophthora cactorum]